jgi:hypothetical protein
MRAEDPHRAGRWAPSPHATADATGTEAARPTTVIRDGRSWPLGRANDVEWITTATTIDGTISSAIPPVFDAYATVALPFGGEGPERHGRRGDALLSVLREHSTAGPWWLGYLDTGADDVVFPDAAQVLLYAGWPYVLVQAGPEQAGAWRSLRAGSFWSGRLPNLMFPAGRCWLVSTLWDDDWTCVGGTVALVDCLIDHPELASLSRRVVPGEDVTPPGHQAM